MPATGGPPIDEINGSSEACAVVLALLFEGAPRFLARLCAARPFGDVSTLFAVAREIAGSIPEAEQLELIDAHPRLGAPPASVSALSFVEQGYDRLAGDPAAGDAEAERRRVTAELDRLNATYEARFGFRYCVFVAGRPRSALLPGFEAALSADRRSEIARALEAVVDIGEDRWAQLARR
ncbi:MAG: 2-oxo-4-hydroxy-4-carboxy-5-ureidoimidazoline decarboxylase [Chloroflexota bacterium]|nr:2-oxo-4-hydroxy-4-carboxy-5-ureidoimidazoline decarboxylase [Chloroflexota bacterium]